LTCCIVTNTSPWRSSGLVAARGYDVSVAADGLECIERLRTTSPTVLVLDPGILWGGADGVLDWLCDEEPLSPLTILSSDDLGVARIPERLQATVAVRLEHPRGRQQVELFVNRLEHVACGEGLASRRFASHVLERSFGWL
jgi:hypothetical protein